MADVDITYLYHLFCSVGKCE